MNDAGRPERGEPALVAARVWVERYEPAHPRRAEVECELARARILQGRDGGERASLARCLADYRRWGLADRQVVHSIERLLNPGAATVTRRSHTTSPPARSR